MIFKKLAIKNLIRRNKEEYNKPKPQTEDNVEIKIEPGVKP